MASLGQLIVLLLSLSIYGTIFIFASSCSTPRYKPRTELKEPVSPSEVSGPEKHMGQGSLSFEKGAFEKAISSWTEAARLYQHKDDKIRQGEALIKLSQAHLSIGRFGDALEASEKALLLAGESGDQTLLASALGHIGNVYLGTGQADLAYQYLNKGLKVAKNLNDSEITAIILNNLGNLFNSQKRYDDAVNAYKESTKFANIAGKQTMALVALVNASLAHIRKGQFTEAKTLLGEALAQIRSITDSYYKAYGLISIGLAYRELHQNLPDPNNLFLRLQMEALNEAIIVGESIGDRRTVSYALGYLGKIYEDGHHYQEALQLTRRAIFSAQQVNASESLYRWHWQSGRLFKALGRIDDAIAAYRFAIYTIRTIRQEMSACYANPESSFRKTAGSICFELVDLLLKRAATLYEPDEYEPLLSEARETVELLKAFELRDYYKDDCVDAARSVVTKLDVVSRTAVVVYPILFQDRMELLVSFPSGLKRFTVKVDEDTVIQEVREFRSKLEKRTTWEFLPHAQKLYDWVIRPIEPDLELITINTLVFVPDGPLRTIPMAALHDGQRFLINRYAIAITPGLDLTDPCPINRGDAKVLALGLSEFVQGFPALPHVTEEIQAIQQLYSVNCLLNQDFVLSKMENELRREKFSIVHIASHGQFGRDVKDTFVLTFDSKLTMDGLGELVGLFRFRDDPLELLTLSACETATGDDRAALGLAGIAIRAGARSAIATLWHINDPSSSKLVSEFYRQLQDHSFSRAGALRAAQLKLLQDPRYQHPGYWSPFLLINDWL